MPPLVTDIDLSLDDQFLYVACWGTGEMRQFDVSDPCKPTLWLRPRGRDQLPHTRPKARISRGPQMVEISRDGKRVYWSNSLYSTWDDQFYPDGVPGAEVMAVACPDGGLELAKDYLVNFPDGYRAHQIRLEGGDCSTIVLLPVGLNETGAAWAPAGLWLAMMASGLYHGVNPGMGWPLAVSAGLMDRKPRALIAAFGPLSVGHLLAMLLVLLPFSLLIAIVSWQRRSASAPACWSSRSVSSGCSGGAIRAPWPASGRRSWGSGRSRSRSLTAPD